MKSRNHFLNMDERNKGIAARIIVKMYFLTIIAMQCVVFYRQFLLGQSIAEFEDFAIILTVNALFLLSALLYFGAIPIQKLKIKSILLIYVAFILLGSLFTFAKYNIFLNLDLTFLQLLDKVIIVAAICGIFVLFMVTLTVLGRKRIDKQIQE